MKYNKEDLVESVATAGEISKAEANRQVDNVLAGIETQLKKMQPEDSLQLVGFLTFEVAHKPEHQGTNPRTKAKIVVGAKNSLKVKAGKTYVKAIQA